MPSRRLSVAILTAVALLGSARTSDAASVSFVESQIGVNTGCPLQTGACAAPEFLFQPNLRFTTTSTALLSFNLTGGLAFSAQAQSAYGRCIRRRRHRSICSRPTAVLYSQAARSASI